jgi:hypothetical protein
MPLELLFELNGARVTPPIDGTAYLHLSQSNLQAPSGIETDVQSLNASWKAMLKVNCPHFGGVHEIPVRETYINGVRCRTLPVGNARRRPQPWVVARPSPVS